MVEDDENEVANLADPQVPFAPQASTPADLPDPSLDANTPPEASQRLPETYPTDLAQKRALLDKLRGRYSADAEKGYNDYQSNRVSADDLLAQRDRAAQNNLIAGLGQASQKIGNFQGKVTDSTLPDFVKGQNEIDQNFLKGRQGLSEQGYKASQDAIKGIEGLDSQEANIEKLHTENEARKAAARSNEEKANPTSAISQFYREQLKKIGINVGDNIAAAQMEPKFPTLMASYDKQKDRELKESLASKDLQGKTEDRKMQQEFKKSEAEKDRDLKEQDRILKERMFEGQEADRQDRAADKADKKRVMSIEGQKRLASVREGLATVDGMFEARFNKNDNTWRPYGDNDFTLNAKLFKEAFGRMQSGGAISKEEQDTFGSLIPTPGDDAPMQQKKLKAMRRILEARANDFGSDLSFDPKNPIPGFNENNSTGATKRPVYNPSAYGGK